MKPITVMLTGAGAPGMPGILKCLHRVDSKFRLIGVDADSNAPSRNEFDKFYQIPKANEVDFIPKLLEICRDEDVDILVPVVTRELEVVSSNKRAFWEIGTTVAVMDAEILHIANNKGLLFETMKRNSIPTPSFYVVNNVEELDKAFGKLGYPHKGVVVKPVIGNGSRGVRVVDVNRPVFDAFFSEKPNGLYSSKDEIIKALANQSFPCEMMAMQLLPGAEYSVDLVAKDGDILASVCRVGLAVASSNQTSSMVVDRKDIIDYCSQIVKTMNLSGNIGFDLKEDEEGHVFVLEINPRLTGGIVTCLAAGANMPVLGINSWLGKPVEMPSLKYGVIMQRYWNERFYDVDGQEIFI